MDTVVVPTIRHVQPEDFEALRAVMRAANEEFAHSFPPGFHAGYLRSVLDIEERLAAGAEVYVAEVDGLVAGTVTLYPEAADEGGPVQAQAGVAGIRATAVGPAFRGRGLGRALVERCVERAGEMGAAGVLLHTAAPMQAAIAVYERCGFRRELSLGLRTDEFFGGDPTEAITAMAFLHRLAGKAG